MEITHRISLSADARDRVELARIGVFVGTGFVTFRIGESSESWPAIEAWIRRRRPSDIVVTRFSSRELDSAKWLAMRPSWHHGYPLPEDGYLQATYDLSAYCPLCGTGRRQVSPFHLKGEPRWGNRAILQVNWIFDEFFVRPDAWEDAFRPYRIAARPVLGRMGEELTSVVQLVIPEEASFEVDQLVRVECDACGTAKYLPVTRGKMPPLDRLPTTDLSRSVQWFGSGNEAHHEVVASQELRESLKAHRISGTEFVPCDTRP